MTHDYVSRSEFIEILKNIAKEEPTKWMTERQFALNLIDLIEGTIAPVEAEPVVHAHWEFKYIQQIAPNCSNCGMLSIQWYPNCPYCRAKMKNGKESKNE